MAKRTTEIHLVGLTNTEIQMVVNALIAVSPSGGSSPTWVLARAIGERHLDEDGQQGDCKAICRMQVTAAQELPLDIIGPIAAQAE